MGRRILSCCLWSCLAVPGVAARGLAASGAAVPGVAAPGVTVPGAAASSVAAQDESAPVVDLPLKLGREALEAGDLPAARRHLSEAVRRQPGDSDLIALMLRACAGDDDALGLWTLDWMRAAADERGHAQAGVALKERLSGGGRAAGELARARVAAVEELARFAGGRRKSGKRSPEELLVAQWAERLALDLCEGVPALERSFGANLTPVLWGGPRPHVPVIKALTRLMDSALANRRTELALRAARCLRGLAVQADFKDLKGPKPTGLGKLRAEAGQALARARRQVAENVERAGGAWTLEELEWMDEDEAEAFTRAHDSFANPGVALSPREWYRVETDCGHGTLLGVAGTVEFHHARLAGWYGSDPFVDRPGLVRIVPESHGLEAEGAPFFWAGGFQGGATTTLRFSCGTIEGLGHGLTHELTHRFDGTLFPGQPAWLTEGKAVWTGAAFGHSSADRFVAQHVSFGTIEGVFVDGYGGEAKLRKLVDGSLEEYRDNYSAGYALYVYLNTWLGEDGLLPFKERLGEFMENCRRRKGDPGAFFDEHFCDGRAGRPQDFSAFATGFAEFVQGFYWKTPAPWTSRYTQDVGSRGSGWVYDEPTWSWARARAEPFFGQDQAHLAGDVLVKGGKLREAVQALVWGLEMDGRHPVGESALASVLVSLGEEDGAWAAEQRRTFPAPLIDGGGLASRPAPFRRGLRATSHLLALYGELVAGEVTAGRPLTARALAADGDRLARWLGLPETLVVGLGPPATGCTELHPFDRQARRLVTANAGRRDGEAFVEDELSGYDERRVAGLWYADEHGQLHVGRRRPRQDTGDRDRAAHQVCAFVRCTDWVLPGAWSLKARVHFTTSYASGAVIIGYTRRDRNVRFGFNAGDFMYAIGESEEEPEFASMGWSLGGLFEREGALPGSRVGGGVEFAAPRSGFDLELLVDGPTVHAFINGERVGTYTAPDGAALEGYLGFATGTGAVRLQDATLQRLDRSRLAPRPLGSGKPGQEVDQSGATGAAHRDGWKGGPRIPPGLVLGAPAAVPFEQFRGRPVDGVPTATNGRLLLWIPAPAPEAGELSVSQLLDKARGKARRLGQALYRADVIQGLCLALPGDVGQVARADLARELSAELEREVLVLAHGASPRIPGLLLDDVGDQYRSWLMFLDAGGVARVVRPFYGMSQLDESFDHWLRVFRDHGRPRRELPALPSHGAPGAELDDGGGDE